MHSHSHHHGAHSTEVLSLPTLIHPQFTPRRNEIQFIKDRASKKPDRQRIIQQRYIFKYFLAITILWLITDSNVRYWYSTGDTQSLLIFHGLQLISLILYYSLLHSNPGYLPINDFNMQQKLKSQQTQDDTQKPEEEVIVEQDDTENATLITKRTRQKPNIKTVDLTGIVIPPGFCERCKFYKPERSKHCYVCDRCVIKYDHHCPLIDHCIGVGNYRLFMAYMLVQGTISFWTFVTAIYALFLSGEINNYIQYGLRVVLFLWMLYQCIIAGVMIAFHIWAISTAQTSHDYTKVTLQKKHDEMINGPDDRRCCAVKIADRFWKFICCVGKFEYDKGFARNWINFVLQTGNESKWYKAEYPIVIGEYC